MAIAALVVAIFGTVFAVFACLYCFEAAITLRQALKVLEQIAAAQAQIVQTVFGKVGIAPPEGEKKS